MTENLKKIHTKFIKDKAKELGFDACGISEATYLKEKAALLKNWLAQNMNGQMNYMKNNFDKRLDPRLLEKGTKSVISLLISYFPHKTQDHDTYKIAKYAYGIDYHIIIKEKLNALKQFILENIGKSNIRVFVDSAPVLDRAWAVRSGLGWVGKNTVLINKKIGSFLYIGELLTDLKFEYDTPLNKDYCGNCNKCMDACPTQAIVKPYMVDASKCIAYLTMVHKGEIPATFKGKLNNNIFGCDACQDVCPWNNSAKPHHEPAFNPHVDLLNMTKHDWENMTEEKFNNLFSKSVINKIKHKNLMRNINFVKEQ